MMVTRPICCTCLFRMFPCAAHWPIPKTLSQLFSLPLSLLINTFGEEEKMPTYFLSHFNSSGSFLKTCLLLPVLSSYVLACQIYREKNSLKEQLHFVFLCQQLRVYKSGNTVDCTVEHILLISHIIDQSASRFIYYT